MGGETTLTSKGQVTIPVELRKAMGMVPGTRIVFTRLPDGTLIVRVKNKTMLDILGIAKPFARNRRKVAIKDMSFGTA